jgi:surface polysaccharide O-acyltransferase-like enzyme
MHSLGVKFTFTYILKFCYFKFSRGADFHFWYIYMIIGLYLFIPIISKWIRNCNEKDLLYFLIIWLLGLFLSHPLLVKYKINIDLTSFSGYIGYLILGYYLSIKSFSDKRKVLVYSVLLILLGYFLTIFPTYLWVHSKGKMNELFYDHLSPQVLMVSIGLFLFIKNIQITHRIIIKINDFISKYSFGIYFVHVLVLLFLYSIGIDWKLINPIIGVPLTTVICLFISGGIIYTINKLPYGKYISG